MLLLDGGDEFFGICVQQMDLAESSADADQTSVWRQFELRHLGDGARQERALGFASDEIVGVEELLGSAEDGFRSGSRHSTRLDGEVIEVESVEFFVFASIDRVNGRHTGFTGHQCHTRSGMELQTSD